MHTIHPINAPIKDSYQPTSTHPYPYQGKLAQSQRGSEEEKKSSGDDRTSAATRGVGGGGYSGVQPPPPRPVSDAQKDRARQAEQTDGTGRGRPHDHRITEAFREKMEKFCKSVEALKRGETGGSQFNR